MEVMPNLLAKRTFHPVMTKKLVEPGYREAPDSRDPMTIVFAKVCRPQSASAKRAVVWNVCSASGQMDCACSVERHTTDCTLVRQL
jgi:hypothetical protein